MTTVKIENPEMLKQGLEKLEGAAFIGFFGDFSDASQKALPEFEAFCKSHEDDGECFVVDVGKVKGVHKNYGVSAVPTVIALKEDKVLQKVTGLQTKDAYERALLSTGAVVARRSGGTERKFPRVVVYVSNSCPWCTKVKLYLRKRGVPYSEVNVSRNPDEAVALQRRTGQTGVPQVNIGGSWVVGFDQPKIDRLLGLPPMHGE